MLLFTLIKYPNLGGLYYLIFLSIETGISLNKLKHLRFFHHDSEDGVIILLTVPLSEPPHPIGMNVLDLVGEHNVQKHIAAEKFKRYVPIVLVKLWHGKQN